MKEGLLAVLKIAFETFGLHRLEANIQPENRIQSDWLKVAVLLKRAFLQGLCSLRVLGKIMSGVSQ